MGTVVPVFSDEALGRSQRHTKIKIPFAIATGASTAAFTYLGTGSAPRVLVEGGSSGSLTELTQAKIDALLGSTNEVIASAAFGSTAIEADATVGFVLDCKGQIDSVDLVQFTATISAGGNGTTKYGAGTKTALTNAAITNPQVFVTASGNLAGRAKLSNLSSGTSAGYCVFEIDAILK